MRGLTLQTCSCHGGWPLLEKHLRQLKSGDTQKERAKARQGEDMSSGGGVATEDFEGERDGGTNKAQAEIDKASER